MKIVAQIDKYKLQHSIVRGGFGEPVDFFEVIWIEQEGPEKGVIFHAPVATPFRTYKVLSNLWFPKLKRWSKKEYKNILQEFVDKLNTNKKVE